MQKKFIRRKKKLQATGRRHVRQLKVASRHPFAVPVITFLVLAVVSFGVFAFFNNRHKDTPHPDAKIVIVSYDKQRLSVPTRAKTVGSLLKKLAIPIHAGDVVEPEPSTQILQDNFRVNIYRAVPVEIVESGTSQFAYSAATTPRSIAAQAGSVVYPEDSVTAEPVTNFLRQGAIGEQVVIRRSTAINLNLFGTPAPTRTLATTVGGMLAEKGITLQNGATVNPTPDTPVTQGMQVFILKQGVRIESVQETIPTPTQTINDPNLTIGARAVRQAGSPGTQVTTYEITADPKTGVEISREIIQTVVTQTPVTQITVIGTNVNIPKDKLSIMQAAGISSGDYGYVDYIVSHEGGWAGTTKYNHSGSGAYGICQALPGSKMASAGADWATNPVTQLRWCSSYANGRFGSWAGAYNYWLSHHYW